VGSLDLELAVQTLENQGKLEGFSDENRQVIEPRNRRVASQSLQAVVYARFFVFRIFLECARNQPEGITEAHKRLWLFMQVAPKLYFGHDIFLIFSQIANNGIPADLDRHIALELTRIRTILGSSTTLFTALDETQILTTKLLQFFRSDQNPGKSRPILKILLSILVSWLPLILSGTGLSMRELSDIYGSVVAKEGLEATLFTDLGAFESQADQQAYLERYLPKDFLTEELAERIGYWLHGR